MRTIYFSALLSIAVATPAVAQTAFDGNWKFDAANAQMPTKPFGWTIANGMLSCDTCTTPYKVQTDGAFHKVGGQPYWDETSVEIVDPMTIRQTWKKAGRVTSVMTNTVSADGKTLTWQESDTSMPNGKTLASSGTNIRVTQGAKGAHPMSGTWRNGKLTKIADESITIGFRSSGRNVTMTTPAGYEYTAVVGGPAVPITGDLANTMAAITMPDPTTLVETDTRDGKVVAHYTFVAQPGGKTMSMAYHDALKNTTMKAVAARQ